MDALRLGDTLRPIPECVGITAQEPMPNVRQVQLADALARSGADEPPAATTEPAGSGRKGNRVVLRSRVGAGVADVVVLHAHCAGVVAGEIDRQPDRVWLTRDA